ncbi:MAG: hypothetical protein M9963_09800 [Kiritimatiellae bacterium]|nr:hypothetical protein [Kiritimatiellia bacterium]
MKQDSYPVTRRLWRALRRVALSASALALLIVAVEIFRIAFMLRRIHPWMGYAFFAFIALAALFVMLRALSWRAGRKLLCPPVVPSSHKARFKDLKFFVQHFIARLKRVAEHPSFSSEDARSIRQKAYDLESMLGAHPLLDDLRRTINNSETEIWQPITERLGKEAQTFAQYKMQAVVRDTIEPPFPVTHPLLTLYHQITMICCIVDCYVTKPSLAEYAMVIRDVWRVMVRGDYFRIGQRLFEGIYRNSPPAGPAAQELGQALSVIWITWTTAQAAIHRCTTYQRWTLAQATAHLDHLTTDSLIVTRDTLIRDVLPMLKLRLRHHVGPAVADAAGFSEQVIEGIAKSVDGVIQSLRAQAPEETAEQSRRTVHGLYRAPAARSRRDEERNRS